MSRILFITLSNIGDAVMTTPVLERLHQLYPDAVIDLVCDPRSSILFENCPYRGKIFLKIKKHGKKGLWKLIRELRKKRYDLIVDLRTDGLSYLLKARQRLTKWQRKPYGPHSVQELISIIDSINPEKNLPPVKIWLSEKQIKDADQLIEKLPGKRILAIAPGANWLPKTWSAQNFAATANLLKAYFDGVILLGGPGDIDYCKTVSETVSLPCLNACHTTDLLTAAAVMAKCKLFIGNDSGLGHLASAVTTPSISVFGPGQPERYHPWGPHAEWVVGENQILDAVTPKQVSEKAIALIESLAD
jgi:heptosyltransferase-3